MRRYRFPIIVAVILLCAGGTIGYVVFTAGVRVTVRNTGQESMRDVTVRVTGRSYSLGDLAPGSSRSRRVSPTSESHIEVEFMDDQDRYVHLDVGCYLEPGYRGRVDIEIRDGKVAAVTDEAQISNY